MKPQARPQMKPQMKPPMKPQALAAAALVLLALAWLLAPQARLALLATWLAAWWFWTGIALGSLANLCLHNLTGGTWGEAIRAPLLQAARRIWLAPPLFLPVLLGMNQLYPWAAQSVLGMARFGELSAPAFKNAWLQPDFFILRSLVYLLLWCLLAWLAQRPALQRSRLFSALALIVYGLSASLAAVDWIMSLMPLWYSSVFGWLLCTGQMLAGMALAVLRVSRRAPPLPPQGMADLGNLLLMYVLTWAYLAFTQFLIIWAADLPHEIAWYLPRAHPAWLAVSWLLALFHFFVPLLVLLSRQAKRRALSMGRLAALLLCMHGLDIWWLILPSVQADQRLWLWTAPLCALALTAVLLPFFPPPGEVPELSHA